MLWNIFAWNIEIFEYEQAEDFLEEIGYPNHMKYVIPYVCILRFWNNIWEELRKFSAYEIYTKFIDQIILFAMENKN